MQIDFTTGSIGKKIFLFTLPLMAGDVFQQLYNVVDTLIVGRYDGVAVLAAVGSSYTLMTFLSSVLIGLCMGSSAWLSIQVGRGGLSLILALTSPTGFPYRWGGADRRGACVPDFSCPFYL